MNIPETRKTWDELETNVQNFLEINSVKPISNTQRPEMKFLMMRLEPNTTDIVIQMRKQTIETLFEEILKRIPIIAK
ncbi:hypothetical protein C5F47_01915 [Nitrosopumilus cobalaminigenes]|uniref:Uncharacterized protein n=1 Tax=Nitrosopumilus cobalaminigenes TaxID=1470066 RepID=A0A7D5R598_9ARCH|nr:hypothetical protein [Nitrosopumilus cobalaminigenes]QLH02404.1 hypothetical protein C5F47_01915 [Nitrosopumilus cobalaminigenes]